LITRLHHHSSPASSCPAFRLLSLLRPNHIIYIPNISRNMPALTYPDPAFRPYDFARELSLRLTDVVSASRAVPDARVARYRVLAQQLQEGPSIHHPLLHSLGDGLYPWRIQCADFLLSGDGDREVSSSTHMIMGELDERVQLEPWLKDIMPCYQTYKVPRPQAAQVSQQQAIRLGETYHSREPLSLWNHQIPMERTERKTGHTRKVSPVGGAAEKKRLVHEQMEEGWSMVKRRPQRSFSNV